MMSQAPAAVMYEIISLHEEINNIAQKIKQEVNESSPDHERTKEEVFGKTSLLMPRFTPPSFGFVRTVSWLYVMYYEVGKINVDFLSERLKGYGLDPEGRALVHRRTVQDLRTYLQHHLDVRKAHDRAIQENCEQWLYSKCRTRVPIEEEHWERCLLSLLEEARGFSLALREAVRRIEQDESYKEILRIWLYRLRHYHDPYEFSQIISIAAADMGRESLDADRLCKRFYSRWVKELELLNSDYIFEIEARKLIEHVLLTDITPVLPITGKDILEQFSIAPGKQVGELLQKARAYYDAGFHSRDALLEKLKQEVAAEQVEN